MGAFADAHVASLVAITVFTVWSTSANTRSTWCTVLSFHPACTTFALYWVRPLQWIHIVDVLHLMPAIARFMLLSFRADPDGTWFSVLCLNPACTTSTFHVESATPSDTCFCIVTDRPVLPRPYRRRIPKGGVTVLEGAGVLARGTRSCT